MEEVSQNKGLLSTSVFFMKFIYSYKYVVYHGVTINRQTGKSTKWVFKMFSKLVMLGRLNLEFWITNFVESNYKEA